MFFKSSVNAKPNFCEACILGKQHKVYNYKPLIDIINKPKVRLNADLFGRRYLLPGVRGYKYGAIFIYGATLIRFSMTIKLKDAIYDKSKFFLKKIEIFISKKI